MQLPPMPGNPRHADLQSLGLSRYVTVAQAAETITLSHEAIRDLIARKLLPAYDVSQGRGAKARWRIRVDDLEAFLASRRTFTPPAKTARRGRSPAVTQYY